ncbi:MAG TPA: DUF4349 domain-containing protein [Actinomycetota bacterium]|nr:DUF4349 domain-containing protein [Actinomycetota bacterium]
MSEIGYLQNLEEDLLAAAWREALGREAGVKRRLRSGGYRPARGRGVKIALVAASIVVLLGTAGGVGYLALGGRSSEAPATRGLARLREQPALEAVAPGPAKGLAAGEATRSALDYLSANFAADVREESAKAAGGVGATGPGVLPQLGDGAKIIKTAEIAVVVEDGDFTDKFESAQFVATRYGGFIESSSTQGTRAGSIIIRVPADAFDDALADLRGLGRVDSQQIRGRDVTAQYVDLHARLSVSKARRDVLIDLMSRATSIEQTIRVQNALDDVQLRIEEIQGQLNLLNDQTDKATIRMSMREKSVEPEEIVENPSLSTAVDRSVAGFFGVMAAVVVGFGYLVPIAAVVVVAWFALRLVRRRRTA